MDETPVMTFLPSPVGSADSPLNQYIPFRSLPPEEQECAAYLFSQLTDRQAKLVIMYVQHWDFAKAMKEAGIKETKGGAAAEELYLKPIQPLVSILKRADQAYLLKKSAISRQRWLEEVSTIAFLDPAILVDEAGNPKQLKDLPRAARLALKVTFKTVTRRPKFSDKAKDDGGECPALIVEAETKYVPYEKPTALKALGEALGFIQEEEVVQDRKPIVIQFEKAKERPPDELTEKPYVELPKPRAGSLASRVIYPGNE